VGGVREEGEGGREAPFVIFGRLRRHARGGSAPLPPIKLRAVTVRLAASSLRACGDYADKLPSLAVAPGKETTHEVRPAAD
jgi:hypothetical protein